MEQHSLSIIEDLNHSLFIRLVCLLCLKCRYGRCISSVCSTDRHKCWLNLGRQIVTPIRTSITNLPYSLGFCLIDLLLLTLSHGILDKKVSIESLKPLMMHPININSFDFLLHLRLSFHARFIKLYSSWLLDKRVSLYRKRCIVVFLFNGASGVQSRVCARHLHIFEWCSLLSPFVKKPWSLISRLWRDSVVYHS